MGALAESIIQQLISKPPVPLDRIKKFQGAGIYALYYTGNFYAYEVVRERNINDSWSLPIYVGKASRKGGRQGIAEGQAVMGNEIYSRLRQHTRSLNAAENLETADFYARWLVVDDIWIALGESALIRETRPVWNAKVDGFGNNAPGRGRKEGLASSWDTLHPGRPWATELKQRGSTVEKLIAAEAIQFLTTRRP